jgi:hypothetical protein
MPSNPISLDYVAGLFDGEGCFTISIQKGKGSFPLNFSPRISIGLSISSRKALESIKSCLGSGHLYYHTQLGKSGRRKTLAIFRIYRIDDLRKFVELLEEKVIIKRREFVLFNEALNLLDDKQKNIRRIVEIANVLNPGRKGKRKWTVQELDEIMNKSKQVNVALKSY